MNRFLPDQRGEDAADQIRAIARFYSQRLMFLGRFTHSGARWQRHWHDSLAVGYIYITPLGFQFAALTTDLNYPPVVGNHGRLGRFRGSMREFFGEILPGVALLCRGGRRLLRRRTRVESAFLAW